MKIDVYSVTILNNRSLQICTAYCFMLILNITAGMYAAVQ